MWPVAIIQQNNVMGRRKHAAMAPEAWEVVGLCHMQLA